jgi:hypothetical protein
MVERDARVRVHWKDKTLDLIMGMPKYVLEALVTISH